MARRPLATGDGSPDYPWSRVRRISSNCSFVISPPAKRRRRISEGASPAGLMPAPGDPPRDDSWTAHTTPATNRAPRTSKSTGQISIMPIMSLPPTPAQGAGAWVDHRVPRGDGGPKRPAAITGAPPSAQLSVVFGLPRVAAPCGGDSLLFG